MNTQSSGSKLKYWLPWVKPKRGSKFTECIQKLSFYDYGYRRFKAHFK